MITVPDEIKELLHQDHCQKNIRIHFPNKERSDICNDLIVKDSVSFTESLCSQNELKFGLCESPMFECEVVGVGNIKGATIEVFCEIFCSPTVSGAVFQPDIRQYVYQISYGTFIVDDCKRQSDMIHRKIQAYGFMSHIENTNAYIKLKDKTIFANQTPYEPNLLGTFLMLAKASGKVKELEYTQLSGDILGVHELYQYISGSINPTYVSYQMAMDCYQVNTGSLSAANSLIYVEYDPMSVESIRESLNEWELITEGKLSFEEVNRIIKELQFPGICSGVGAPQSEPFRLKAQQYVSDNCNYIYAYGIIGGAVPGGAIIPNFYIYLPSGGAYFRDPTSFPSTPTRRFYYLPDRHFKVYSVDLSDFPEALYAIRDVAASSGSVSGYVYDPANIDYVKTFQSELETKGLFGNLRKDNSFAFINIQQQFGLNPSGTLYPGNNTYPEGVTGGKLLPEDYQTCWYDDEYTLPYGAVVCTYKNSNNEDNQYTLYLTGFDKDTDTKTYKTYSLENNEYIKSGVWTEQQIAAICATIGSNLEGVRYMPVDFVGRGLPYVEAGDTFEILTRSNDSITTIVLHRTITGEQTLTDSYKSV